MPFYNYYENSAHEFNRGGACQGGSQIQFPQNALEHNSSAYCCCGSCGTDGDPAFCADPD